MSGGGIDPAAASAAAVAEVKNEPIKSDFRGVEITLPPKIPAVLALDLAEMRSTDDDMEALGVLWRILHTVLGDDVVKVRNKVADGDDGLEDLGSLMEELLTAITAPYSMTPGESSASDKS